MDNTQTVSKLARAITRTRGNSPYRLLSFFSRVYVMPSNVAIYTVLVY